VYSNRHLDRCEKQYQGFWIRFIAFQTAYEIRPRNDKRGVDLISDVLPFGRLWYDTPDNAIGYPLHSSRSHSAVIRVHDDRGKVIETHEHQGDFKGVSVTA